MNRLHLILLAGMVATPATAQPFIFELKPKSKEAYPPPPSPVPVAPPRSDTTETPNKAIRGQAGRAGNTSHRNLRTERGRSASATGDRNGAEKR